MTPEDESFNAGPPANPPPSQELPPTAETPQQRVDAFLEGNQELFATVRDRWADARNIRRNEVTPAYAEVVRCTASIGIASELKARGVGSVEITQRKLRRYVSQGTDESIPLVLHDIATKAASVYRLRIRGADASDMEVTEIVTDYLQAHKTNIYGIPTPMDMASAESMEPTLQASTEAGRMLAISYVFGYQAQDNVFEAVRGVLADDDLVEPFVRRIVALSTAKKEDDAYIGLLETLATHLHETQGNASPIYEAIARVASDPVRLRQEFATHLLGDPAALTEQVKQARKIAAADIVGMQMLTTIITDDYGHSREDLTARVAERFEQYDPLAKLFAAYAKTKVSGLWRELRTALAPYEKPGRILPRSLDETGRDSGQASTAEALPESLQMQRSVRLAGRAKTASSFADVQNI